MTTINQAGTAQATDNFGWSNPYGGIWGTATNWYDTTVGTTAIAAPGANGTVAITGGVGDNFTNILGTGAAAQLSIIQDVLIWGTIAVGGTVSLQVPNTTNLTTELDLDAGAKLTAGALSLGSGSTLAVGDASKLGVSGTTTLTASFMVATNGSTMQFGGLIANNTPGAIRPNYNTIAIDSSATMEIGSAGGAATGAITIDSGVVAALGGILYGNLVVNGTLSVQARYSSMSATRSVQEQPLPVTAP
jgi:hypothetical protein